MARRGRPPRTQDVFEHDLIEFIGRLVLGADMVRTEGRKVTQDRLATRLGYSDESALRQALRLRYIEWRVVKNAVSDEESLRIQREWREFCEQKESF